MVFKWFIVAVLWFSGASMSAAADAELWQKWILEKNTGHQLAGRIWSVADEDFISPGKMADRLAAKKYVLLGEIHDNADHHVLQAWVIAQLARRGRKPAIVMEMISSDQDEALDAYLKRKDANAAGLGKAIGWEKSGWPQWLMYQPIAEQAFANDLPIYSANLPRADIREIGKKGFGFFKKDRQKELLLNEPLGEMLEADLRLSIVEGHCNMLPAAATGPMVNVQRVRDALFADKMLATGGKDGAVLIAGSGHVRSDRAVPWYLERREPGASIGVLVLMEASEDKKEIADYAPKFPDGRIAADYIWFTPMAERDDPCEGLKKHMMKKYKKKSETR